MRTISIKIAAMACLLTLASATADKQEAVGIRQPSLRGRELSWLSDIADDFTHGLSNFKANAVESLKGGVLLGLSSYFGSIEVSVPGTDVVREAIS